MKKTSWYKKIYNRISKVIYKISPEMKIKLDYRISLGKGLNLKEPQDFNEKIQWLNLYSNNKDRVKCSDKYLAREFFIEKGFENYLPKLLGVYKNASEINFEELPNKFVLKCTHGCGYNIICKDKSKLDVENAKRKLNKWLKEDFGAEAGEIHYSKIEPRIICEEFIEGIGEDVPIDYKIHCFNGVAKFALACVDRYKDLSLLFYDLEWNRLEYQSKEYYSTKHVSKPSLLNEMIRIAEQLAKDFDFVRVDFFESKGKLYIGELTFTPNAGRIKYLSKEALIEVGKMLEITEK